jgi:hypothetical protein
METTELLTALGYDHSPAFLTGIEMERDPEYGHVFRKAAQSNGLMGAYVLRGAETNQGSIPVVYLCTASTDAEAREIHRLVWNQSVVPFVIVVSPGVVRVYPGFSYESRATDDSNPDFGALRTIRDFNRVSADLSGFSADSIDTGKIWKEWGKAVTPETRVDWRLLSNLEDLDRWIRESGVQDRLLGHAIIGKFVYLHYLRARSILSNRKFNEWGIQPERVLGRDLRLDDFARALDHLDDWLNGSVFPLTRSRLLEFGAERLRQVASVFQGDTVDGQLHLDFPAYDFSFIPIETLSVIYQQFLHSTETDSGTTAGEARGAYYTPVPLVNFMLDRLESIRPLEPGMRVLDPSCGSGAFLVQCYRRLIEGRLRAEPSHYPRPTELRKLLVESIFGLDVDEDACRIAEMSLTLTLLEYVDPPDLTSTTFKLPSLGDKNILRSNAFDTTRMVRDIEGSFDWVVGNPPWMALNTKALSDIDRPVSEWMEQNRSEFPTGGNQVAEAFAWRTKDFVRQPDGLVHLLIPAMSLVRNESKGFRRAFFQQVQPKFVANFSNFSEVLFAGRSRVPAASILFHPLGKGLDEPVADWVDVYSPFVANHPMNRGDGSRGRKDIWTIIVNASELRAVRYDQLSLGEALPWKIAMWGSPVDYRLINRMRRHTPTIGELEKKGEMFLAHGLQLRHRGHSEAIEIHQELAGKPLLNVKKLRKREYLFRFPAASLRQIPEDHTGVRKGRYETEIKVCKPPHVIVGEARTFAVYSDSFLTIPHPQIGIQSGNTRLLKAIALYLNSDFAYYYEFLLTAQAGFQKSIMTLHTLRALPLPFKSEQDLDPWEALHNELAASLGDLDDFGGGWVERLNELTTTSLGLSDVESWAVHDLVRVRMNLLHGKVDRLAIALPAEAELTSYAEALRFEMDAFFEQGAPGRHAISIIRDSEAGIIDVILEESAKATIPIKLNALHPEFGEDLARARARLIERRGEWLYFDRNLRIYDGKRTILIKPMERMHWTRTQAMNDAADLIAESLAGEAGVHASLN